MELIRTAAYTQTMLVLKLLQAGVTLTVQESANKYGVLSLTRRICDLKDAGYEIHSSFKTEIILRRKRRVKQYWMGEAEMMQRAA